MAKADGNNSIDFYNVYTIFFFAKSGMERLKKQRMSNR